MTSPAKPPGFLALTFVLFAACGGNPLPEWKTSPTPGADTKRIDHLEKFANVTTWHRSPYSRLDDGLDFPIYVIVAEDHTACVAPAEDWTIANHGDFYPCPGKWRVARPT